MQGFKNLNRWSVFNLSIVIVDLFEFLKDQRSFLYSHFGGTGGIFFTSFQPFVMTFGYKHAIPEGNS